MIIEICATNLQSALNAQKGGAARIELCAGLDMGGLTPSAGLIRAVRAQLRIPVHVLIRPREGDFCYSDAEMAIMLDDIQFCREAGVDGVVIGALDAEDRLHVGQLQAMQQAAGPLFVTCHRAFDFTPDPFEALDTLIDMGFGRVLTSGQAPTAPEGQALLERLVDHAAGRITVMPGAGINADNIRAIATATGATEFHLSAKKKVMRNAAMSSRIPGLALWHWESNFSMRE